MTLRTRIVLGAFSAILAVGLGFHWVGQKAQSQLDALVCVVGFTMSLLQETTHKAIKIIR